MTISLKYRQWTFHLPRGRWNPTERVLADGKKCRACGNVRGADTFRALYHGRCWLLSLIISWRERDELLRFTVLW